MKYPNKRGRIDIYPEISDGRDVSVHILGDPDGLRYFGRLLRMIADEDQEKNDDPDGWREHTHLFRDNLGQHSCQVVIERADAKGTGEYPYYMAHLPAAYYEAKAAKKREDGFPTLSGVMNIFIELSNFSQVALYMSGDPEGLRYFADFVTHAAGIYRDTKVAGGKSKEEFYLNPAEDLDHYSCFVVIHNVDAVGDELPGFYQGPVSELR